MKDEFVFWVSVTCVLAAVLILEVGGTVAIGHVIKWMGY